MKVLVQLYYANWCGHCVRFKPEWEKLKKMVENDPDIVLEDYESEKNSQKIQDEGISGYPTILVVVGDKKTEYNGPRTAEALLKYIKEGECESDGSFKQCGGGGGEMYGGKSGLNSPYKIKYLKYKAKYMKMKSFD